jgi:hypothetical protein
MFDILGSLAKATVGVVIDTPLAIVKDTASLVGALPEKEGTNTAEALQRVGENLQNAVDPNR